MTARRISGLGASALLLVAFGCGGPAVVDGGTGGVDAEQVDAGGRADVTSLEDGAPMVDAIPQEDATVPDRVTAQDLVVTDHAAPDQAAVDLGQPDSGPPPPNIFSPVPVLGDRDSYTERTPDLWAVVEEDGDRRYRIVTSDYEDDADRLGAYAVATSTRYSDLRLSVRAKTAEDIATNPGADYGLIFGWQDPQNYYYMLANAGAGYSQLFKIVTGNRVLIASADRVLIPDESTVGGAQWHTLEVIRVGNDITVEWDGDQVLAASDTAFGAGAVGVGSYNDAALFDDIRVTPPGLDPPPSITSLTATPPNIEAGSLVTLEWTSLHTTSCSMAPESGSVATSGSRVVTPATTTTYTLSCTGPGGSVEASVTVEVIVPGDRPEIVSFGADPQIVEAGGSSTLSWTSQQATGCSISQGVGTVDVSGQQIVTLAATTTYTLTCTGAGGTAEASVTVTVTTTACSCLDEDGDGHYPNGCADNDCTPRDDCAPTERFAYPGAPELCDDVDNQCPGEAGYGEVDEGCVVSGDEVVLLKVDRPGTVVFGVPFSLGAVAGSANLEMVDVSSGEVIPADVAVVASWAGGSVRWAHLRFFAAHSGYYGVRAQEEVAFAPLADAGTELPFAVELNGETLDFADLAFPAAEVAADAAPVELVRAGLLVRIYHRHQVDGTRSYVMVRNVTPTDPNPLNSNQPDCAGYGKPAERAATLRLTGADMALRWGAIMSLPAGGNDLTLLDGAPMRAGEQVTFEITTGGAEAEPPTAFADSDYYLATGAFDTLVPFNPDDAEMLDYELNMVVGIETISDHRNQYSHWREPFLRGEDQRDWDGGDVTTDRQTHNNEYESGHGYLKQFLRTVGRSHAVLPAGLAATAFALAETNARHHADVDIYHVTEGPFRWMWNGPWQHPNHGGTGNGHPNRSPFPPNTAHYNGRVDLAAYYFTGCPVLLDAYAGLAEAVQWKVENGPGMPGISNTTGEMRAPGHLFGLALDWYEHLGGQDRTRIKAVLEQLIVEGSDRVYLNQASWSDPSWRMKPWMGGIYVAQLARAIDLFERDGETALATLALDRYGRWAHFLREYCMVPATADRPTHMPYQVSPDPASSIDNSTDAWNITAADALARAYPVDAALLFATGSASIWYPGHPVGTYSKLLQHVIVNQWGSGYLAER